MERDKYEDPIIRYTNQVIDNEIEKILEHEVRKRIKVFRYNKLGLNEFLFYIVEKEIDQLRNEISKGNKLILRKGWKKEMLVDINDIDSVLTKMDDYY